MTAHADDRPKPPRREFLDLAISGVAACVGLAALYPLSRFLEPVASGGAGTVVLGREADFEPGTARTALLDDQPILVLRRADGSFRALVAVCTHLQCVVHYVPEQDWIECACHQGRFSWDGRPLAGPPSAPLAELGVQVVAGAVVVSAS